MMSPKRNIELKARCRDLGRAARAAEELGARRQGMLVQTDTYFRVPSGKGDIQNIRTKLLQHAANLSADILDVPFSNGRLKLRETDGRAAELIWYARDDSLELRGSDYYVLPIPQPAEAKADLSAALGLRGVVRKRRELWLWHNVRIHLDEVDGLGSFVEFEAVIAHSEDERDSPDRLARLSDALGIGESDRIAVSYSDLLDL